MGSGYRHTVPYNDKALQYFCVLQNGDRTITAVIYHLSTKKSLMFSLFKTCHNIIMIFMKLNGRIYLFLFCSQGDFVTVAVFLENQS